MKFSRTFSGLAVLGLFAYAVVGGISNCKKKGDSHGGNVPDANKFIPNQGQGTTALTIEPDNLILAAGPSNTNQSGYNKGVPKSIIIKNVSSDPVSNIAFSRLPASIVVDKTADCLISLPAGATCNVKFTPGAVVDTTQFTVNGQDTIGNQLSANATVTVLDYGSKYQDGYVFALTPNVFDDGCKSDDPRLSNCSRVVTWEKAKAQPVSFASSIKPFLGPDGAPKFSDYNGIFNTNQLLKIDPDGAAAAKVCTSLNNPNGTNNWYLPAICELVGFGIRPAECLFSAKTNEQVQSLRALKFVDIMSTNGKFWSSSFHLDPTLPFYVSFTDKDSATTSQVSDTYNVLCAHIITKP